MAPRSILDDSSADPKDRAAEAVYQLAMQNLPKMNNEMIIPDSVAKFIGIENVSMLRKRFAAAKSRAIRVVHDSHIGALRFISSPRMAGDYDCLDLDSWREIQDEVHVAVEQGDAKIPISSPHVPRPANSFILYRQNLHKEVTDANPGVKNTEISRIIADMWHKESPEVRAHFKKLADQMKKRHGEMHPDYRYSPRRSDEIPRRTKLRTNTVSFLHSSPEGLQFLNNATHVNGYYWDLDTSFMEALDVHNLIRGPQTVAPPALVYDNIDKIVDDQVQRYPVKNVQFPPLTGNEFAPDFDMESLLNLPGAN